MRKMTAKEHLSPGSIGRPVLKLMCPYAGWPIPAKSCRRDYCRANRGYKEISDEHGIIGIETLCAYDEMKQEEK